MARICTDCSCELSFQGRDASELLMSAQQRPWQPSSLHLWDELSLHINGPIIVCFLEQEACSKGLKETWLRRKMLKWSDDSRSYQVIVMSLWSFLCKAKGGWFGAELDSMILLGLFQLRIFYESVCLQEIWIVFRWGGLKLCLPLP